MKHPCDMSGATSVAAKQMLPMITLASMFGATISAREALQEAPGDLIFCFNLRTNTKFTKQH
jgi:hypothetical protein